MDMINHLDIFQVKWAIMLITISLSVMDFYIRKIPNSINLATFAIFLVAAFLIGERTPFEITKDVGLVALVAYFLYYINALGGGDCKYIIAISPIISVTILFKIVALAMAIFVLSFLVKKTYQCIRAKQFTWPQKFELHKMPFIWSLVPGFYIFAIKF